MSWASLEFEVVYHVQMLVVGYDCSQVLFIQRYLSLDWSNKNRQHHPQRGCVGVHYYVTYCQGLSSYLLIFCIVRILDNFFLVLSHIRFGAGTMSMPKQAWHDLNRRMGQGSQVAYEICDIVNEIIFVITITHIATVVHIIWELVAGIVCFWMTKDNDLLLWLLLSTMVFIRNWLCKGSTC